MKKIKKEKKLSTEDWYFWTVVLEKTLESPLDCKEIQPVHPKRDQSCLRPYYPERAYLVWSRTLSKVGPG